ncbi:hypothetical protein RB595_008046 [Gaeumannomyces hyphopodioides]
MQRRRRPDLEISVVPAPRFATATGTVAIKTTTSSQDCFRDTSSHRADNHSLRSHHRHRDLLQHALDLDRDQDPDQDQHLLGLPQHQHPRPRQAHRASLAITTLGLAPKQQTQPPAAQGDLSAKHATGAFLDEKTPTTLDETLDTIPGLTLAAMSAHGASDGNANPMPHKDDAAPGANTLGGAPPNNSSRGPSSRADVRMSHDLSLSPRNVTRDSLVTNMLLSLDQLSMSVPSPPRPQYNDDAAASPDIARVPPMRTAAMTGRPTGAGHEYSYSSDLDTDAETSSRTSVKYARGRRSNSGSNFHSTLGRINSLREPGQRNQPTTPRAAHSRGRKGSKSSSSNSMDAGYPHVPGGGQRWASGFTNGSPSGFSPAQNQQPPRLPDSHPTTGWQLDFSDSFFSNTSAINNKSSSSGAVDGDDFDAAPTPTIPAGPRRLTSVPSMPSFPTASARTQSITTSSGVSKPQADPERKRSTRSSRSATVGRSQSRVATSRDVPPMPGSTAFDADSAPAPSIGYGKSKEQLAQAGRANNTAPTPVPQPKEKLGFFRRVFGSRRDSNANSIAAADSQTSKQGNNTQQTEASGQARAAKAQSTPPSRDSSHSTHGGTTHGTLHKKTSAFFRRQKKVQHEPPPPPPPVPQSILDAAADATPVAPPPKLNSPSSNPDVSPGLTRALEPYLASNGSDGSARTARHDDPAAQRATAGATSGSPKKPKGPLDLDLPRSPRGSTAAAARTESKPLPAPEQQHHESTPQKLRAAAGVLAKRSSSSGISGTPTRQAPEPPAAIARTGSFLNCDSSDTESESESRTPVRPDSSNRRVRERRSTKDGIRLVLPLEGSVLEGGSVGSRSATSLPSVKVDEPDSPDKRARKMGSNHTTTPIDEPGGFVIGDPTEDERQKAQKIYDGNEDFIQKEKAAAWMGEEGPVRQRTLQAYMSLFDFAGRSIVSSLRDICARLILKAETQQVDRILAAFAKRWCECNPKHGFKATDVVHTICYSIMLLNTDLHMADIEQKMTRSQFVKNTIGTIRQALADTAPDAFGRQSILPGKGSGLSPEDAQDPMELEKPVNSFRQSFLGGLTAAPTREAGAEADECGPLVKTPFEGTLRAWEAQIETVLKDTYASIRDERLPLFGAEPPAQLQSSANLSVIGLLKRSPSVLSKAPSESQASVRGRVPSGTDASRLASLRWTSKSRSRVRGAPGAPFGTNGFSSSRTSFDDGGSIWSPTISSATRSRYSLGRTQTSMSIDSIGSGYTANFPQSIGFANALSQAIIREDAIGAAGAASLLSGMSGEEANSSAKPLLEDESLELAGPPWVKEGRVIHKHHLDGIDKRAKDRNWSEVFAVVQKGSFSLFSFAPNKSLGKKSRGRAGGKGAVVVGGGNWQDNATNLATFSLKQTLASALPPPGYSSSRPHVWALSLPTGAVHLFQVSTPETSQEFVTTVNYWSARLSTHPLVGGISNIEYGWGDDIVNNPLVTAITEATTGKEVDPGAVAAQTSRPGSAAAVVRGHRTTGSMHSRAGSFRSGSLDFVRARSGSVQSASAVMDLGNILAENPSEPGSPAPTGRRGPRSSSSFSSSVGPFGGSISAGVGGPGRGKLPGDRIHIAEWRPPAQSLRASTQGETEQLSTLSTYVASIEEELRKHNALRSPMLLAFSPRSNNASRAMGNWQRKSEYLLRESVKYRTYVDALQAAAVRKEEVYGERKEE